jgi:hypothetical protein
VYFDIGPGGFEAPHDRCVFAFEQALAHAPAEALEGGIHTFLCLRTLQQQQSPLGMLAAAGEQIAHQIVQAGREERCLCNLQSVRQRDYPAQRQL